MDFELPNSDNLSDVPNAALREALAYCVERISELRNAGLQLSAIAERIGVGESGLKQLIRRAQDDSASDLRRGAVFAQAYAYFRQQRRSTAFADQEEVESVLASLMAHNVTMQKCIAYSLLMQMIRINPAAQDRAAAKAYRRLYCFRNAVHPKYIIKSQVDFVQLSEFDRGLSAAWEFYHRYVDNNGIEKRSDGVVFVIQNNIYLLGDVQNGEGLDIMIVREPVENADFMIGFHVSIDDHRPFFANMVYFDADRFDEMEEELGLRTVAAAFAKEENTGIYEKDDVRAGAFLKSEILGKSLHEQLNIEGSNGVLRIKQRHLIPNFDHIRKDHAQRVRS